MRHQVFQRAAKAAFSTEDWLLLGNDLSMREKFSALATVEDVEEFVFNAYDRLKSLREKKPEMSNGQGR
jgi:hypothetical protein